ncbi:EamA family transporter [Bacillus sp. RAR_GA_16]|uniref:EamA family transporter n=1 Tax=Bacillus sp. RAR_GA_16 TaxID=2876774 RepID=UPI001CCB5349|nr:DMT family transporter [Bacillus sp. RAR_GA_16]MCA0173501.1 DMT family transporter [Bacillus sp. RAR_GA_16]
MWKYVLLVLAAGCSLGSLSTITKIGIGKGFSVGELLAGQFSIGWLILLLLLLLSKQKPSFKGVKFLLIGGVMIGCVSIFYTLAVSKLPASIAVLLLFQFTWIGLVIDSLYHKKWPDVITFLSVSLLLIGTILASGIMGSEKLAYDSLGVMLGLLSAICFAMYIFIMGRTSAEVPAIQKSFFMVTIAGVLVITTFSPGSLLHEGLSLEWTLFGFFLAILGNIFPVLFMAIGVPKIGASMGTILSSSELPAAVFLSAVVLHEAISTVQWSGVLLILVGIMISQREVLGENKIKKKAA